MPTALTRTALLALATLAPACRSAFPATGPALPDQHGDVQYPLDPSEGSLHVLVFVMTDCPIANGYAPTIQRYAERYASDDVRFFLVHVDPVVTRAQASAHAREFGYEELLVVLDREHDLVRAIGATITPEVAVVTPGGALAYRGRIDDWYAALGRKRRAPTRYDLAEAVDALLAGRPVPETRTTAVGCFIPDHPTRQ